LIKIWLLYLYSLTYFINRNIYIVNKLSTQWEHINVARGGARKGREGAHASPLDLQKYFLPVVENLLDALFAHPQLQNQGQLKPSHQTSRANFNYGLRECRLKFCLNSRFRLEENDGRRWCQLEKHDTFKHTVSIKLLLDCLWAT
jgi:hypothetical protein